MIAPDLTFEAVLIRIKSAGFAIDNLWFGHVRRAKGNIEIFHGESLRELIANLPAFFWRGQSEVTRLQVEEKTQLSQDELLHLLQFNHGARGLDISRCSLHDLHLSVENVARLRDEFFQEHQHDPEWSLAGNALNLIGLTANEAEFYFAELDGANLSHSRLNCANFDRTSLVGCNFEFAKMARARFEGANLEKARLALVEAESAEFSSYFANARMNGATLFKADLTGAQMDGVNLSRLDGLVDGTKLSGVRMWRANLDGANLELLGAGALSGARLLDASFDRTRMRRDQLGEAIGEEIDARSGAFIEPSTKYRKGVTQADLFDRAGEVYRLLKVNFGSIGRNDDASWAHFKQRDMYRLRLTTELKQARDISTIARFTFDSLARWTTGYGERPWRPIATGGTVIVIFSLLFWALGMRTPDRFSLTEALIFSGASFFTMSFSEYDPLAEITQMLAVLEAGAGILIIGLYLWTISNASGR